MDLLIYSNIKIRANLTNYLITLDMAYIKLNNDMPGIVGPLWTYPRTAKRLSAFTQELLMGKSALTSGEKELIAAYVSSLNNCDFCCNSHTAAAVCHLDGNEKLVEAVKANPDTAQISPKMNALLKVAAKVQQSGRLVTPEVIADAKKAGVTDDELHDTVLVAAAFCMFNRYVDGLGTLEPEDKEEYKEMGKRLSTQGYTIPPFAWLRNFINRQRNKKLAEKKKN
jgi:uncharacterized peroxidase-related enzyme